MNIFCSFAIQKFLRIMRLIRFLLNLCIIFCVLSCSSKRDILYIQDSDNFQSNNFFYSPNKIKKDDILKITISSLSSDAVSHYNDLYNQNISNSLELMKINGYHVDENGFINFPSLGKLNVEGLSTNELQLKIYNLLLKGGYLVNHNVDVKLLNLIVLLLLLAGYSISIS